MLAKTNLASKRICADVYQELLRQHLVPGSRVHILAENKSFSGFRTDLLCQDHPAVVGGILDSRGMVAIFNRLEFTKRLFLAHFAGENLRDASCQLNALCPFMATEWDWLAASYFLKTCRSFRCCQEAAVVKNGTFIK
jgi:hypothetical protein